MYFILMMPLSILIGYVFPVVSIEKIHMAINVIFFEIRYFPIIF